MDVQHVQVKFFIKDPSQLDLTDYLTIFNEWIQDQVFDDLLVDVADYRHIHGGPGVLLVGHDAAYSLDTGNNRPGLLYSRKTVVDTDAWTVIKQAIQTALQACRLIEEHETQKGKTAFKENEMLVGINDRLIAPNTGETYRAFEPVLRVVLDDIYGRGQYTINRYTTDPRERFAVHVSI